MNKKKKRILIVDDDMDICRELKDIFNDSGYEAEAASDKFRAIKMAKKNPFDIALVDLVIEEGEGGIYTLKKLKEFSPEVKLFIMTAYSREKLIKDAFSSGAVKLFNKPFDIEEILSEISKN